MHLSAQLIDFAEQVAQLFDWRSGSARAIAADPGRWASERARHVVAQPLASTSFRRVPAADPRRSAAAPCWTGGTVAIASLGLVAGLRSWAIGTIGAAFTPGRPFVAVAVLLPPSFRIPPRVVLAIIRSLATIFL